MAGLQHHAAFGWRLGLTLGLALLIGAVAAATGTAPAVVISLLLAAPLCEELVFRAGLQQALIRRGQRPAVVVLISAAAFALLHGLNRDAALGLAVFGPALLLGVLYQRTRSLRACVALHAAMNLAWLLALGPAIQAASPAR